MQQRTDQSSTKVLPFDDIIGHELISHSFEGEFAQYVAFETFDDDAQMMIETIVHWTNYTKYCVRKWPRYGSLKYVITNKQHKIYAEAISVATWGEKEFENRPELLKRAPMKIRSLCSKTPLIEIAGAMRYASSKREQADKAAFLSCPWERDNKKYQENLAKN